MEEKSKIVPNTFQNPNVLVDDYMRYLTGNETKCYLVVVRKTLGWLKRRDCISLSQITEKAGIEEGAAREAMKALCRFGLVVKTADNDPLKNYGPEYELELDDMKVSMAALIARHTEKKTQAAKQTSKARAAAESKRIDPLLLTVPPTVEQTPPPTVEQTTQKPLSKAKNYYDDESEIPQENSFAKLAKLYESNMGIITPIMADTLKEIDENFPADWHLPAIKVCVDQNKRTAAYLFGVLQKWKEYGFGWKPTSTKAQQNSQRPQKTNLPQVQDQLKEWLALQGANA